MAATGKTHCFWVLDDSGSMIWIQEGVRRAVKSVVRKHAEVQHTFVCFSCGAQTGPSLDAIPYSCGGTEIEAGFKALLAEVKALPALPDKIITVFVSDGEDNNSRTIVQRLRALGGVASMPGSTSAVLFTVAVGSGFPTNMVLDALRPAWHNTSDYLPLVFPLVDREECGEVFGQQLERYMFSYDHHMTSPPAVGPESSQEELEAAATAIYNFYVMKASREQDAVKSQELLTEAKRALEGVVAVLNEREAKRKAELGEMVEEFKQADAWKPLASRLITKFKKERASGLTLVQNLIQKLNALIDQSVNGQVLARLSDEELAKALGWGNVAGKHFTQAYKYHAAEFEESKCSLLEFLRAYGDALGQAEADAGLADYIMTQEESYVDAKHCVDDIEASSINSIVSLADVIAVLGRTLTVKKGDGVQINPWLIQVKALPTVMRMMNSVDWLTRHQGNYVDQGRGEDVNCLLPIAAHPTNILREAVGQHLTTFFLCRNEALTFPQALASLIAATVTFCLDRPQPLPSWIQDELSQALTTYVNVYDHARSLDTPAGLNREYLTRLAASLLEEPETVRSCLVTEDEKDRAVKCEHLTKFVLGLAVLIDRANKGRPHGRWFTSADLRQLMIWAAVEMVGRCLDRSKHITSLLGAAPPTLRTAEELLGQVPTEAALRAVTLQRAVTLFRGAARALITPKHPEVGLQASGPDELLQHHVTNLGGVRHYQFSEASLVNIFTSLDALAGNKAGPAFFTLTPTERLSILLTAYKYPSSSDRCKAPLEQADGMQLARMYINSFVYDTVNVAAPAYITRIYTRHSLRTHLEPLLHIPRAFTLQYQQETGRDLEADLDINPLTRLPRLACTVRACPHFLHRLPRAVTKDGAPRISDILLNHLGVLAERPAYTRTVVEHVGEGTDAVAQLVLAGAALQPCKDSARERAVGATQAWWAAVQEVMPGTPDLAGLVAADMASFQHAEERWGGYEDFRQAVEARVYEEGEVGAQSPRKRAREEEVTEVEEVTVA